MQNLQTTEECEKHYESVLGTKQETLTVNIRLTHIPTDGMLSHSNHR